MAAPKTCERCEVVSFSRSHDLTRRGWTVRVVGGCQPVWICAHCLKREHEQRHDEYVRHLR